MGKKKDQNSSLSERLKKRYRLVVLDDETLGEVRTHRITGLMTLLIMTIMALVVASLAIALLCFTPLKHLVPGYADVKNNYAYQELVDQLDVIEGELEAQRVYTNGVKNLLNPSGLNVNATEENNPNIRNSSTNSSNQTNSSNKLSLEHYYFCSPLKGEISASFDLDKKHFGTDIVAEKNTPVKSILAGVVIDASQSIETGKSISIQHNNDVISVYKHNSTLLKKIGERVKTGEAIAIIGNTGEHSSGPHVHLELWSNGRAVDPAHYLSFDY